MSLYALNYPTIYSKISMAGALILGVVYSLDIKSRDDPYLKIAEETVRAFSEINENIWLGNVFFSPDTSKYTK